jgi:hypothetical protein
MTSRIDDADPRASVWGQREAGDSESPPGTQRGYFVPFMRPRSPASNRQVVTDPEVSGGILGQRLRRKTFEPVRRSVTKRLIPL